MILKYKRNAHRYTLNASVGDKIRNQAKLQRIWLEEGLVICVTQA